MPGFLGYIGEETEKKHYIKNTNTELLNDFITNKSIYLERRTINKFMNEKILFENERFIILTEGIILNSLDLIEKYKSENFTDTIIKMYKIKGNEFFEEFRGSFSGLLYDKKQNKKIIYTNHIGDKQIYYSKLNKGIVFGSEINYILEFYNANGLKYTLDVAGAYYLLTYGYMLESTTLFAEVKKLNAGHYILIENDNVQILKYYNFNNADLKTDQSENEIIDNIDYLFRESINNAFKKDKEYGYKHLVGLSGGLDSRMTTWVANDLGYGENIVNYTFSQSDYLDENIAKNIARDLKHEWIFKFLDNGLFLKQIEETVKINAGSSLYYTLAHGKSTLDLINTENFGIVHTGQVGGILKGYYNKDTSLKYSGKYSLLLKDKNDLSKLKKYKNEEEFLLLNRQFNGTLQGNLISQKSLETISPFLDIEFMEYCMSIPVYFNINELFIKWMIKKYPESTNYIWENTNGKVTDKTIEIFGRQVLIKQIPSKILKIIKNKINPSNITRNSMNPLDYWYNTNEELRNYLNQYYHDNIDTLSDYDDLLEDCIFMYNKGSNIEKNQVLTLLAVMKIYF